MRALFLLVALVFTVQISGHAQSKNPTDFTLYSASDSSKFTLSEAKGKYVALHFLLRTECFFCMRHTSEYANNVDSLPDVIHVFIKPDAQEDVEKWANKVPDRVLAQFPIYRDPDAKLAKQYKVKSGYYFHNETMYYPALVLLDPNGTEIFRYTGTSNMDRYSFENFKAKLKELKNTRQN